MPVSYAQLEEAFYASDMDFEARAWINIRTGKVRVFMPDIDCDEPPPDGDVDWRSVPDARDLDLKQRLVESFVDEECPNLADHVRRCFSRRGAWRAFKDLLVRHHLLDRWHEVENQARRRALLAWATEEGIDIVEPPPAGNP